MEPTSRFKEKMTRRDFLGKLAIFAFILSTFSAFISLFKVPFMRSFPEPSKVIKVGDPANFKMGEVTTLDKHKINIFREEKGFYALSAVCTHLGCLVKYAGNEFKCPCHGSVFNKDGNVVSGPAPRALEWYRMSIHSSGQLVVNTGDVVPEGTYFNV